MFLRYISEKFHTHPTPALCVTYQCNPMGDRSVTLIHTLFTADSQQFAEDLQGFARIQHAVVSPLMENSDFSIIDSKSHDSCGRDCSPRDPPPRAPLGPHVGQSRPRVGPHGPRVGTSHERRGAPGEASHPPGPGVEGSHEVTPNSKSPAPIAFLSFVLLLSP